MSALFRRRLFHTKSKAVGATLPGVTEPGSVRLLDEPPLRHGDAAKDFNGAVKNRAAWPGASIADLSAEYWNLHATRSEDVLDASAGRLREIEALIAQTPSSTIADAQIKAELLAWFERQGLTPPNACSAGSLAASLARDFERLVGGER